MCGRRTAPVFCFGKEQEERVVAVDKDEVRRIARLAALALSEEEIARFQGDLEAILGYVGQVQEADLDDLQDEHEAGPEPTEARLREDVVRPGLTREQALANAPDTDGEYFRVPPAIPMGSDSSR
jgi:aspartyl-tRNA(Asn)/glutamyl-tRNA(Gln) amidotransferase subunit C